MKDRRYAGSVWRKLRLEILARDGYRCQIRSSDCDGEANQVDHIVAVNDGGAFYDPDNLRAACNRCNSTRAVRQKAADGWRRSPTQIVLIAGPPCAGKSTYAQQHAEPGDMVIDYDLIAAAIGSPDHHDHPPGLRAAIVRARGALLTLVRRGEVPKVPRVWIVSSDPNAAQRYPHHQLEVLDPGMDVVLERAARERPGAWLDLIRRWYGVTAGSAEGAASRAW